MSAKCESCEASLANPFRCDGCGEFQPLDPLRDHFTSLGLEPGYPVDRERLERRYLELSRQLHPDHAGTDPGRRSRAVLHTAQLNDGYATLRDPMRAAEYVLKLKGGATASDDKSVPAGFLEEMMERRIEVQECLGGGDAKQVATLQQTLEQKLDHGLAQAAQALGADDLPAARQALNVAAYDRGLLRDLKAAL